MPTYRREAGNGGFIVEFTIRDSATGQLKDSVVFGDVTATEGLGTASSIPVVTMTEGTWVSGGFVQKAGAKIYQFGVPDALIANDGDRAIITVEITDALDVVLVIEVGTLHVDVVSRNGNTDTASFTVRVEEMADNVLTGAALDSTAGAEIAALVETYIVNEGDATAVMQAIANLIADDWVQGDASPLAIAAAVLSALGTAGSLDTQLGNIQAQADFVATGIGEIQGPGFSSGVHSLTNVVTGINNLSTTLTSVDGVTTKLDGMLQLDGSFYQWTPNAMEHAPAGGTGATPEEFWSYSGPVGRTLTMTHTQVQNALSGDRLVIQRGDDLSVTFTGLGSIAGRSKLYLTIKESKDDSDDDAIIQVEETANLVRVNRAAASEATDGTLTVLDEDAGDVKLNLKGAVTALLSGRNLNYDIQVTHGDGRVETLTEEKATVNKDVTQSV